MVAVPWDAPVLILLPVLRSYGWTFPAPLDSGFRRNDSAGISKLVRYATCWMSHRKDLGSRRINLLPGLVDGFSEVGVFDGGIVDEVDGSVE